MRINYSTEKEGNLYDFTTIQKILGVNKSKVHRELKKLPDQCFIKYKNQHLYNEKTLYKLMEEILLQRLDKIENQTNEL